MQRILFCLPLCLCLASDRPEIRPAPSAAAARARQQEIADRNGHVPTSAEMEKEARKDPVAFLEDSIKRYNHDVKAYTGVLQKQEAIGGKINPTETIKFWFREKPFSVLFHWLEGARLADAVEYLEGENDDKLLVRPRGIAARLLAGDVLLRDVNGPDARSSGRYTLDEFGIKKGTERTLAAWKAAQDRNALDVDYLGVKKIKELGDRPAWVLRRTNREVDSDGVKECTIYVDTETGLQIGTVLKDDKGLLVGSYYFRDLDLNPKFKADQFGRAALKP